MNDTARICPGCYQRRPALDFMFGVGRPRKHCISCAGEIGETETRARREASWLSGSSVVATTLRAWVPTTASP